MSQKTTMKPPLAFLFFYSLFLLNFYAPQAQAKSNVANPSQDHPKESESRADTDHSDLDADNEDDEDLTQDMVHDMGASQSQTTTDEDEDVEKGKAIAGNIGLATDYVYRGVTQTNNQPALQGGFDWKHPIGFSLGVYGSNVYFPGSSASLELDSYGAFTYAPQASWNVSAGITYLSYFQPDNRNTLVVPLRGQWREYSLEVDYSPNFKGDGNGWYILAGWNKKLRWETTFSAALGYSIFSESSGVPNYVDTRLSAAHDFLDLEWMLSAIVVKHQNIGNSEAVSRIILSATKAF